MWWTSDVAQYSNITYAGMPFCSFGTSTFSYPLLEIISAATSRPSISRIDVTMMTSSNHLPVIGLGVPAIPGVSPQPPPLAPGPYDPSNAAAALTLTTAWQKPPTSPVKFLRRITFPYNSTTGIFSFVFPRGLTMNPSSSLVVWNIANAANVMWQFDFSVEWDE